MSEPTPPNTAVARTEAFLARIGDRNPTLNAVITVTPDAALESAHAADQAQARGNWLGLLHGMPMLVKDNINTAGVRSTSGASFLSQHVPNRDATVVERLRNAGAILMGKANLHELCFGVRSNNSVAGQCHNPWSSAHIPGGSSGGSGAAIADGFLRRRTRF